jgi:hypothetical protein
MVWRQQKVGTLLSYTCNLWQFMTPLNDLNANLKDNLRTREDVILKIDKTCWNNITRWRVWER